MAASTLLTFAWLEVTGLCQESCSHCYADSGPTGTHGTMSREDWLNVIDQLADMGTRDVQFIGGEPTLYPHLSALIRHARERGLGVEVFSNMAHIREELWDTFRDYKVKLATSYYSDDPGEHDRVTRLRGSHKKTRANIERAVALGIPMRGGVVAVREGQRVREATRDLVSLGVPEVGGDRMRAFGRASAGAAPTIGDLCGHCAHEKCAIGPTGDMWPCVLGRFLTMGNVKDSSMADVWNGARAARVTADIGAVHGDGVQSCTPPQFLPMCGPCTPCVPSVGHCDPEEAPTLLGAPTIGAST
ncbi:radical SAM protein [Streptomyces sp. NPDC101490]|uniref:radical SAM protein n=1 Tax=Streptomyces sp. NPDC101490 TaxID=3366143 RepID=UPI003800C614